MTLYRRGNDWVLHQGNELHFLTGPDVGNTARDVGEAPVRISWADANFVQAAMLDAGFHVVRVATAARRHLLVILADGVPLTLSTD